MYISKIQNENTDALMRAVLRLDSMEDAYRFFEDLCTIKELESIAQRYHVAKLLKKKQTYQQIASTTGASTATISRINRSLNFGADGYLRQIQREEEA